MHLFYVEKVYECIDINVGIMSWLPCGVLLFIVVSTWQPFKRTTMDRKNDNES